MNISFKKWLTLSEISFSASASNGSNNQATQTSNATTKIAQNWLSNPENTSLQADLVANTNSGKLNLTKKLLDAGAKAVQKAPASVASQTTAPEVAAFLQKQFSNTKQNVPDLKPKFMKKS